MRNGRSSGASSRDCSADSAGAPDGGPGPERSDPPAQAAGARGCESAGGTPPSRAARVLLATIAGYRVLLWPLVGGTCRFTPSCSAYAEEALARYGAWRGAWLAAKRLARCHPFGGWGYDPVPARDPAADA